MTSGDGFRGRLAGDVAGARVMATRFAWSAGDGAHGLSIEGDARRGLLFPKARPTPGRGSPIYFIYSFIFCVPSSSSDSRPFSKSSTRDRFAGSSTSARFVFKSN